MADYCFETLTISNFLNKIRQPNFENLANQEFQQLAKVPIEGTTSNFFKSENFYKNRYHDIPCWDHTRVILTSRGPQVHDHSNREPETIIITEKNSGSTYIHANFVHGFEDKHKYICCQGPTKDTAGDLWALIWENNTRIIVSLTEIDDEDKVCYEYWVNSEGYQLVFGRYIIKTLEIKEEIGFTITRLCLTDVTSGESRPIIHFWYTNWPEHGTPTNLEEFTTLLSEVNLQRVVLINEASLKNLGKIGPILIHCSAGVGRTGTFCVIDNAIEQLKTEKSVSLQNTVLMVRRMRHLSVLTMEQYLYCYKVIEYLILAENKKSSYKNRYHDIPCWDHSRVILTFQGPYVHSHSNREPETIIITEKDSGSTYIHANFVHGFEDKHKYICCQGPTKDTAGDLWALIWDNNTRIIVSLTEIDDEDKVCYEYWVNSEGYQLVFGRYIIKTLEIKEEIGFTITRLCLTDVTSGESRPIIHFWYTNWPEHGTPTNLEEFTTLLSEVNLQRVVLINEASLKNLGKIGPILIHCSAGVGRTGTFCVIDNAIEQLKTEKSVSLQNTVLMVRRMRHLSVLTMEQYLYCYKVIEYLILAENKKSSYKNRYHDIPCWDHSRVILTFQGPYVHSHSNREPETIIITEKDSGSTYIHANFVHGFEDKHKYICCQGPTKDTAGDLWALIWDNNTRIIVSLTEIDDEDKVCYEYWVNSEGYQLVFGRYIIKTLEIKEEIGFTITRLCLTDVTSGESRPIIHFWYTNWPEHGTPTNLEEFTTLLSEVNLQRVVLINEASLKNLGKIGPILIHCSAGVGRTGTFCVIDNAIEQLKTEKSVSLQNTVLMVRRMRHLSVLTMEQYLYCYKVIEYLILAENKKSSYKNRYHDIPCWDHSRVILTFQGPYVHSHSNREPETIIITEKDSGSTYIHANFVHGFEDKHKYICCQGPTKDTAGDLWALIWDNNTRIIVSLTEIDDEDKVCYEYWVNSEGYQLVFGRYIIKTLEIKEEIGFTITRLCLTDVTSGESRPIIHFWYTNWPEDGTPTNLEEFTTLLSEVNLQRDVLINEASLKNLGKIGPILIHCSAGVGRTGTFCVIDNAIEQLKTEKSVSLQNTVLMVRRMRHSSVLTLEQYLYCYKVIEYLILAENKKNRQ